MEIEMRKKTGKLQLFSILIILSLICSGILIIFPSIPVFNSAFAASTNEQTSYSDFENGLKLNVKINGSGEDAELMISNLELYRWGKSKPSCYPSGRFAHAMAPIYWGDKVLLFGGINESGRLNDTWIFDFTDNNWTEMKPESSPKPRGRYAMATICRTDKWRSDKVLLFGGYPLNNETWVYDLSENNWIQLSPKDQPNKRHNHAMASINGTDKVLLFGGTYGFKNFNDTWIFDLSDNAWTNMQPKTTPSAKGWQAMATIYGTDNILLFGGPKNANETWVYDLSENNWTKKTLINPPKVRAHYYSLASIWGTDKIVLFGGYNNNRKTYSETWVYDNEDNEWTKLNLIITPTFKYDSAMSSIFFKKKVLLFGGISFGKFLNETWQLTKIETGMYLSTLMDMGERTTLKKLTWVADTPPGTGIIFQIRTARTKLGLTFKKFLGPNGTKQSYYNTSDKTIWSGHKGDRWLQYGILFISTKDHVNPRLKSINIIYNKWPNTNLDSPTNNATITEDTPTFSWLFDDSDSEHQQAFQVLIDDEQNFNSIDFDSGEQNSDNSNWQFPSGTDYSTLPDGSWYWKVRTKDSDGDWSEYSEPWMIIVDTQVPNIMLNEQINNGVYYELNSISGQANDPAGGTDLAAVEVALQRPYDGYYWDGKSWQDHETWLGTTGMEDWSIDLQSVAWHTGQQYRLFAKAMDHAGNIGWLNDLVIFTIDRTGPISTINYPLNNACLNEIITITGSCIDYDGSGIASVEISIGRTTDGKFWDGSEWSVDEYWLPADGKEMWNYNLINLEWTTNTGYIIRSRAIDNLGNYEKKGLGTQFIIDNKPPTQVTISINNGNSITNKSSISVSLGSGDSSSDDLQMSFSFDGKTWTPWENYDDKISVELPPGDGNKTVFIRVKDNAGNIAESVSAVITKVTDADGDDIPDEDDAFPLDPAASQDSDEDGYPDIWNPGKSEENSTSNLRIDEYPNDPERNKKAAGYYDLAFKIFLLMIAVLIFVLIIIVNMAVIRRKYQRIREPYIVDKVLRKARDEILHGKDMNELNLSSEEITQKLKEIFERGEMTEDTYQNIVRIIENENL
jgi:hypothetical protein